MSLKWIEVYFLLREEAELNTTELIGRLFEHGLRPTEEGTVGTVSGCTELSGPGLASELQLNEFVRQVDQSDEWYCSLYLPGEYRSVGMTIGNSKTGDGVPEGPSLRISI